MKVRSTSAMLLTLGALALGVVSALAASPPDNPATERELLVSRAQELAVRGGSLLRPAMVRGYVLQSRLLDGCADRIGSAPAAARSARLGAEAAKLLKDAETQFVLDPNASTIDLIPEPDHTRFATFKWDPDDYPGGPVGPHEDVAIAMDAALSTIRPERRANSNQTAVVKESEYNDDVWKYIQLEERPVPGQPTFKLNRWALASFVAMREAAKKDGVDIVILSSNRLPTTAARNAARENNSFAVARFSAHILGLAMDIQLRDVALQVSETSTRPMSNVIAMRRSRAHKWVFLHGAAFGWYPYQHEPWHWEYNPPGFKARFWRNYSPPAK